MHQLVRQASGYREQPGWLTVGQAVDVSAGGSGGVVLTPTGQRRAPAEGSSVIELAEPGFYEVRDAREGQALQVVASNVDLAESDPARVEPAEVTVAVTGRPGGGGDPGAAPTVIPDEVQEQAQRIWWYLLFAGILLLIAESWLARRLSPVRH